MLKLTSRLASLARNVGIFRRCNWYGYLTPNVDKDFDPLINHVGYLTTRGLRRTFLIRGVLNQKRDVINAEIRKTSDTVLSLKHKGLCPGVIIPFDQDKSKEVDVVLEGKIMKSRIKRYNYGYEQVYVRVEGKQYRCVLQSVRLHYEEFIRKVSFREYVPGQPNPVTIKLHAINVEEHEHIRGMGTVKTLVETVKVLCYNEEYPLLINYDMHNMTTQRIMRVGDIANMLPPGLILDPSEDPNKRLVKFEEGFRLGQSRLDEPIFRRIGKDGKIIQNEVSDEPQKRKKKVVSHEELEMEKAFELAKTTGARMKEASKKAKEAQNAQKSAKAEAPKAKAKKR